MKYLGKYKYSIISGIILSAALSASFLILGELNPVIAAVGGLLYSIPIQLCWHSFLSPVIIIKNKSEIKVIELPSLLQTGKYIYKVNRILVKNTGRSAARNCKAYIVVGNSQERICWTVPKERPNATINAKDEERLDFCAFYQSGGPNDSPPRIIAPTENDWVTPTLCRKLDEIDECEVLITADNAEPVKAMIRFDARTGEVIIN